jgi:hypothetical protein
VEENLSQLFNVHGVKDVRQTEIHTTVQQAPAPSIYEVEMLIEKLKRHKLPRIYQIPAESIKAAGRTIRYEIHKLIDSIRNKEELPEEWKKSIILPLYMKGDKIYCSNYGGISLYQLRKQFYPTSCCQRLTPYTEEIIGDHQCGFRRSRPTADHVLCIREILEEKWEYNETAHQLFIDLKKTYHSVRREVLYNILIEFGIPMKLVRLIKMFLIETCSRVRVGKNVSDILPIKSGLKQGNALSPLLFNLALEYDVRSA